MLLGVCNVNGEELVMNEYIVLEIFYICIP